MPQRTIALFDVIGVKEAMTHGTAGSLLENFWAAADAWTNSGGGNQTVFVPSRNANMTPGVRVRTFTDSALLMLDVEVAVDDFFNIALDLKRHFQKMNVSTYVVFGKGEMLEPTGPALGGHLTNGNGDRMYENVFGSGEVWVNTYLADRCVQSTKEWHSKYSVYATDVNPSNMPSKDKREYKGVGGGTRQVHALN